MHEIAKVETFSPGSTVMPWHIRSPWNQKGNLIYRRAEPVINTLDENPPSIASAVGGIKIASSDVKDAAAAATVV